VGLDDEVQVIALHREMHDAKVGALRGADGAGDGVEEPGRAEGGQVGARPQRDVDGMAVLVLRLAPGAGRVVRGRACAPRPDVFRPTYWVRGE